jgi:hypothetical protein
VLVASGGSEFGGSGRVGVVSADAGGLGGSGGVLIRTGESMDKQWIYNRLTTAQLHDCT